MFQKRKHPASFGDASPSQKIVSSIIAETSLAIPDTDVTQILIIFTVDSISPSNPPSFSEDYISEENLYSFSFENFEWNECLINMTVVAEPNNKVISIEYVITGTNSEQLEKILTTGTQISAQSIYDRTPPEDIREFVTNHVSMGTSGTTTAHGAVYSLITAQEKTVLRIESVAYLTHLAK